MLKFSQCLGKKIHPGYTLAYIPLIPPPYYKYAYHFKLLNHRLCVALRGHGHTHSHGLVAKRTRSKREKDDNRKSGKGERKKTNINLQAATIHVVGDLLQTVGVIVAGYIIWFRVSSLKAVGGAVGGAKGAIIIASP